MKEPPFAALGALIRAKRKSRELSLQDLADATRISRRQIAMIETGANVSLEYVARVVAFLEIDELPLGRQRPRITPVDFQHLHDARARAVEAAETAAELLRRVTLVSEDRGASNVVDFPEHRIRITSIEERQTDALRSAIKNASSSMVEWRQGYRADPEKHLAPRRGKAAAGHGYVAALDGESDAETQRQIPEHYWNVLGVRYTVAMVGDSLFDLGYVNHDLLFVRPLSGAAPRDNEIVICERNTTEGIIVKVYAAIGRKRWLLSANEREAEKYPPLRIEENDDFKAYGIVVARSGYALPGSLAPRPTKGD